MSFPDIPHGAKILIRSKGRFLSIDDHGVWRLDSEAHATKLIIQKCSSCLISLQREDTSFVSSRNGIPFNVSQDLPFHGANERMWEQFHVEYHIERLVTKSFSLRAVHDIRTTGYLAPVSVRVNDVDETQVRFVSNEPFLWQFKLAEIPNIGCEDISQEIRDDLVHQMLDLRHHVDFQSLSPPVQRFCRQVFRAHHELGFFTLSHLGLPMDAFTRMESAVGQLVNRDRHGDKARKHLNHTIELCYEKAGIKSWTRSMPTSLDVDSYTRCADKYFQEMTSWSEFLLCVFALCQAARRNLSSVPYWLRMVRERRILGLRALAYRPGPEEEKMAESHLDTTYVTLLVQNQPGLQVLNHSGVWMDVEARPTSVVVNTGTLLQNASEYYTAVCHRVVRLNADATRLSMPFFYDKEGSEPHPCH